jgi:hypothetical protein
MIKEVDEGYAGMKEWWDADEREKQKYLCKKLRKNNVYTAILFPSPYVAKWNPNTGATISGFACWQEHAFPVCMDILEYEMAQDTDWCAGLLVRVWWLYLRLRFAGTDLALHCL